MKKILLITTFFLILFNLRAQYDSLQLVKAINSSSEKDLVADNSRMIEEGYYFHAYLMAKKLVEINPESSNYCYRLAFLTLELYSDFITAKPLLEKAILNVDVNFDMYSVNEKSASLDAYYHMGRCYHLNNDIPKARAFYTKFLEETKGKSPMIAQANLRLLQCDVAEKLLATPKKYRVKNLGKVVNTNEPEYSPVISLDGSALYFTSRKEWPGKESNKFRDPSTNFLPEDIYVSYLDFDSTWTTPTKLDFCDPEQMEASISVSSDERRIYVYQDIIGAGDIFFSDLTDNKFKELNHFKARNVNTKYWEPHSSVSPDGLIMYFTSDRPGGLGGRDIYKIQKLPDGTWSQPINMGPKINTPYDEDCPFLAIDNKSLYFSSNGPKSMGGFDVFLTILDNEGVWSDPINLGYPLNSTNDDVFYTTTVNGLKGYLSSFREGGYGEKDIYEIQNDFLGLNQLAVFKGRIKTLNDKAIPESMGIFVNCLDCGDGVKRNVFPNLRNGLYYSALEPCRQYELIFYYVKEGKQTDFYKENVSTDCYKKYDEIYREVLLDVDKMEVVKYDTTKVLVNNVEVKVGDDIGKVININPIYFDFDKFNIRPDAAIELDKIVKIMNEYPGIEIELGSHTDCRGKMVYNDWLSQQRATSSANYIKERIKNPQRIYGKGYGERNLKVDCPCEGKSEKKQAQKCAEEVHQLNRRTEFLVIKLK
ncbi:MAG: PD40 domain-containing protein [Flavobacteriia bacterium]|nr:PD40 domain-containing protein [Flavobacteriia bacterium]